MNGKDHSSHSTHSFNVGRMRIKLCRGWITKAREIYSPSMQVLFWQSDLVLVSDNMKVKGSSSAPKFTHKN